MQLISPEVPPTFGDIRDLQVGKKRYLIISNCGAASVFYAGNSGTARRSLPGVVIRAQCQGHSGGAVGYHGKSGTLTVARLGRKNGEYMMQVGLGRAVNVTEKMAGQMRWGSMWPMVAVDINVDMELFLRNALANHYSFTFGNYVEEIQIACRHAGIRVAPLGGE